LAPENVVDGRIVAATKNDGQVNVPMSERLGALVLAAVAVAENPRQPLVCALGILSHTKAKNVGNTLRHRLAVHQRTVGAASWTWHDLRRTAAQRVYAATGNLQVPMSLLGHKSMLTTLKYLNAQRPTVTPEILNLFASSAPASRGATA
jgi:integrase